MPQKICMPMAETITENYVIQAKGIYYKISVANEGSTWLKMGIKGIGKPFLKIPPNNVATTPAYPRVWSTESPDIPFGVDFEITFDGGKGHADIISFSTFTKST